MTIKEAWAIGRDQLAQASFTPEIDARLLLEHVLGASHSYIIAHADEHLTAAQESAYQALLLRAGTKEPIPYLIGHAPFFELDLIVSPAVLIPRPETEGLVEAALEWAHGRSNLSVCDVGTGSGCVAIALSRSLKEPLIYAVDISRPALNVARKNVGRFAQQVVHLVQCDLLSGLAGPFDMIVANLPYVADDEWTTVDDSVKWFEPSVALFAGPDGLTFFRKLLVQAADRLRPGGAVFLEIGWRQGAGVQRLAASIFPQADVTVIKDVAGQDRIVRILNR